MCHAYTRKGFPSDGVTQKYMFFVIKYARNLLSLRTFVFFRVFSGSYFHFRLKLAIFVRFFLFECKLHVLQNLVTPKNKERYLTVWQIRRIASKFTSMTRLGRLLSGKCKMNHETFTIFPQLHSYSVAQSSFLLGKMHHQAYCPSFLPCKLALLILRL